MNNTVLGAALMRSKSVTREQLANAVKVQHDTRPHKLLGRILVEQGVLEEKKLDQLLSHQARTMDISKVQDRYSFADLQARLKTPRMDDLLRITRDVGASDLYVSTGMKPSIRIHGNHVELPGPVITPEEAKALLFPLLTAAQLKRFEEHNSIGAAIEPPKLGRFRMNIFRQYRGTTGLFRVIPENPWTFERTGMPSVARSFTEFSHGLVLVTGPVGNGKSTTMAALLDHINRTQKLHIVTIEDPVECIIKSDRSFVSQREVGRQTESFASGLRAALREDPDVIVVGELRDPESAQAAVSAAETGHLVFGTMHTPTSHRTILRLLDQFPAHKRAHIRSMLAGTLRAVICQQLIPEVTGRGRSLATEILVVNTAVSNLIREERAWQIPMVLQTGAELGMRMMDQSLKELVAGGRISMADALARATDPDKILEA